MGRTILLMVYRAHEGRRAFPEKRMRVGKECWKRSDERYKDGLGKLV